MNENGRRVDEWYRFWQSAPTVDQPHNNARQIGDPAETATAMDHGGEQ